MIRTLTGPNSYMLIRKLAEITADFAKKYGDLAIERIEGEETELQAIIDAVSVQPFLIERKLIVARNLSQNKAAADKIEQIISSIGEDCDLVIYEPTIDRRSVYFKVLKSKTELDDFTELNGPELAKWLVNEAKKQGVTLGLSDANYLVERVSTNQAMLANELEKLITNNPAISRQQIDELVPKTPQGRVFELLDAAFGSRKSRALELYEEQRAQKVEPQAILAMIAWQLELIVLARLGKAKSSNQIAKDAGVSPFPVQKAQSLLAKITDKKLKQMVDEAYKIDRLSKTKAIDLDEALKTYITTL